VDDARIEVNIEPGQPAQLAGTHPGEHRRDEQGPSAASRGIQHRLEFDAAREIDTRPQWSLFFMPGVGFAADANG